MGERDLERYLYYASTLVEHEQVRKLDALLPPADKLRANQKERLIELLAASLEQQRNDLETYRPSLSPPIDGSPDDLRRMSEVNLLVTNQENLQRMKGRVPLLIKQASEFLSPAQLEVFSRMNHEDIAHVARWNEERRSRLSPEDAAMLRSRGQAFLSTKREPIQSDVTFEVSVTLDEQEPMTVSHHGRNGSAVLVEADELRIEVKPTLYSEGELHVHNAYFAELAGKEVRLNAPSSFGGNFGRLPAESIETELVQVVTGKQKGHMVRTVVRVVQ